MTDVNREERELGMPRLENSVVSTAVAWVSALLGAALAISGGLVGSFVLVGHVYIQEGMNDWGWDYLYCLVGAPPLSLLSFIICCCVPALRRLKPVARFAACALMASFVTTTVMLIVYAVRAGA